jgi:hypothetical protein
VDWINMAHDRNRRWDLVNTVMDLRASWNAVNFLTRGGTVSFSRSDYLRTIFFRLQDYKLNRWTLSSDPVQYTLVKTATGSQEWLNNEVTYAYTAPSIVEKLAACKEPQSSWQWLQKPATWT